MNEDDREALQSRIDGWRSFVLDREGDADPVQVEEQLRTSASSLITAGLDPDEAFLVALKRVSASDPASRYYAQEYAAALLQSPVDPASAVQEDATARKDFLVMLGCAVAAGTAIKIPALFGLDLDSQASNIYMLNLSLFVLPFLVVFFAWKHRPPRRQLIAVSAILLAGAVFANAYPLKTGGFTETLTALHLPIALWLAVGVVHAGGDWLSVRERMEYTRFTGEWFVTYTLIALGGGVLTAMTAGLFETIGVNVEGFLTNWLLPCGAMGAVIVASWLVESRRNLVGGLAPMLARVFTPLFALMLAAVLVGVIASRGLVEVEREVLILFDVLLVLVLAMLLYAISARDRHAAPGLFDRIQLALVASALAVDIFALSSIVVRLSQFGFSANKTAALGLNLILLVNLAWSAFLQVGFIRSRRSFADVERWQMRYLPVYAIWAAIVVIVFPLVFGFA